MKWLTDHAHGMHKDEHGVVVGLSDMAQVSLCKAHSSTLYRAQKKHERSKQQPSLPPPTISPPPEYNGFMDMDYHRPMDYYHHHHHHPPPPPPQSAPYQPMMIDGRSSLAARVRNMGRIEQYHGEPPDLSNMSSSTSLKRKRTEGAARSSASTPLLAHPYTSPSSPIPHVDNNNNNNNNNNNGSCFSMHQLPPLQQQPPPPPPPSAGPHHPLPHHHHHPPPPPHHPHHHQAPSPRNPTASMSALPLPRQYQPSSDDGIPGGLSRRMSSPQYHFQQSPPPGPAPFASCSSSSSPSLDAPSVDTVSLKSSNTQQPTYYVRNLAITDLFTFRDLLTEVEMIGSPPAGKRIVISDEKNERIYPMDQPIRSVIRRPVSTHVELCLGLKDTPSIDWSTYTS